MHGLINLSVENFVRETYGSALWANVAGDARLGFDSFETLTRYDHGITYDVIDAACARLGKPRDAFLEDLGMFLCSNPKLEAVRRLMRFGGETYKDFLISLDDLADRVHLALPELEVPDIEMQMNGPDSITMRCTSEFPGFGQVLVGILQAMADDYGALALFEHIGSDGDTDLVSIQLLAAGYAPGRNFDLAARAG